MCVDRLDAEMQLLGDLRDRVAVDQCAEHLPLPLGEEAARILRRLLLCGAEHDVHERLLGVRAEVAPPLGKRLQRIEQLIVRRGLGQIAHRPVLHRLVDILLVLVHAQHEDLHRGEARADLADAGEPAHPRH